MTVNNLKAPRPTPEIDQERKRIEEALRTQEYSESLNDRFLNIMNNYDWSTELFSEKGKYGLKKWDGTLLLPAAFDNFRMMSSYDHQLGDRVVAMIGDKEGVAVMDGQNWRWMLEPEFDHVSYPNSLVGVKKGDKWGILDLRTGQYLVPPDCDVVYLNSGFLFCNGIGIYQKGDKYGVIDNSGTCTPVLFDEVSDDIEGKVRVRIGEQWGFINEEGQFEEDEELAYFVWDLG